MSTRAPAASPSACTRRSSRFAIRASGCTGRCSSWRWTKRGASSPPRRARSRWSPASCGQTAQARAEAEIAATLGYDAGLLSLGAWRIESEDELLEHCRAIAEVIPLFGFYLQPAVGGRVLSYEFWREFAEIPNVWAIKIAPFNRYQTIDVVRAVAEAGRDDIALYTGNDDNIVADLLTPFPVTRRRNDDRALDRRRPARPVGGVDARRRRDARRAQGARVTGEFEPTLLSHGAALTDANGAVFDAAHGFAGCIPGIHEVLRRQGLLDGTWCLDPRETLSPGQADEITRVERSYPEVTDAGLL